MCVDPCYARVPGVSTWRVVRGLHVMSTVRCCQCPHIMFHPVGFLLSWHAKVSPAGALVIKHSCSAGPKKTVKMETDDIAAGLEDAKYAYSDGDDDLEFM
jgi:hypothetical protein